MCGIGGYLGDPKRPRPLDETPLTLRHRGPDAQGTARFQTKAGTSGFLAAARLSILDPSSSADQPMISRDGTLRLVYNGEIYNHRELRRELEARGAQFRSHSDTEVILEGHRLYGPALWSRLRGMFALALWNSVDESLWLVRDEMGIKPLYYVADRERLVFASELRALLASGAARRQIDPVGLTGFLTFGSVPEPQTILDGVKVLPPGHAMQVRARSGVVTASPPTPYVTRSFVDLSSENASSEQAERFGHVLTSTVAAHLQSDVPVGLLLSGGVDSTAIAMVLREATKQAGATQPLTSFTLAAAGGSLDEDARAAAETARLLELPHAICQVDADDALAAAPRFLAALDQPSVDGFNTFLICERVRAAGCKLLLSGLGGDELFLGYGHHRLFAAAFSALRPAARFLHRESQLSATLYRRLRGLFPPIVVRALLHPDLSLQNSVLPSEEIAFAASLPGRHEGLLRVREHERRSYLVNTLLRDGDVMSMAHGVELRVPLCDADLWRHVSSLGSAGLLPHKQLLVDAVAARASNSAAAQRMRVVAQTPKRGFVLPLSDWLAGPLRSTLRGRFGDPTLAAAAGLDGKSLVRLLRVYDHAASPLRRRLTYRLWALFVLLSFARQHDLRRA